MAVTYFLLLSSLGLAITTQAQECNRPVPGANMDLKGDSILLQRFPDGTQVSFACDVGYVTAGGSAIITCSAGTWSPVRLRCERKNCGPAEEVTNGQIHYEGTEFGDKLEVTCDDGHTLVGSRELICGAEGKWLGRLPFCEVTKCEMPPQIANGLYSPVKESYDYGEVVQYTCQRDYTLGGSKTLSCSENGMFSPAPPTCAMVECEDPNIPGVDVIEGSRPPHRHRATVTIQCRSGYNLIGARTTTCGIDNQWSPPLPKCEKIKEIPTTPKTTTTTTTTSPSSPKKPEDPYTTKAPDNSGNGNSIGLGIGLTVLIGSILTVCGCYFCGVPAFIKEKRRKRHSPVAPTLLELKMGE